MNCRSCGYQLATDTRYCQGCGEENPSYGRGQEARPEPRPKPVPPNVSVRRTTGHEHHRPPVRRPVEAAGEGFLWFIINGRAGDIWRSPRRIWGGVGGLMVLVSAFAPWTVTFSLFGFGQTVDVLGPMSILIVIAALGLMAMVYSRGRGYDAAMMLGGAGIGICALLFLVRAGGGAVGPLLAMGGGGLLTWAGNAGLRKYVAGR